jgi:hypothetical protein
VLCVLPMTSGCASFGTDWKLAGKTNPAPSSIEGRWEGKWISTSDSHSGKLRCLLTPMPDGRYLARFHSYYWKIFTYSHDAILTVTPQAGGTNRFSGSADLGKMAGGVFTYDGHVTTTNFFSNYSSKKHVGVFQMTRPEAAQK